MPSTTKGRLRAPGLFLHSARTIAINFCAGKLDMNIYSSKNKLSPPQFRNVARVQLRGGNQIVIENVEEVKQTINKPP